MKKIYLILIISVILFNHVPDVFCEDASEEARISAIQNRIFHRNHEIDFDIGYVADEEFYYPVPIGLGYTYNFSDHFGWEVARAQYIFTQEKDLKSDLEDDFGVTPSEFAEPTFMLHSHLTYRPFYGKDAVMNRGIINRETFFFLGGGFVNYKWHYSEGNSRNDDNETVASASFGVGTKYFINEKFSVNLEVRDIMNFWDGEIENRIYLGVGLGFRFNMKPRKAEKDETLDKLNRYLKEDERDAF